MSITQPLGSVLIEREYHPWLDATRSQIAPYYWDRYRRFLTQQGFASGVVSGLDEVTDRILGLLQNPSTEGPWDRRGMVIGHVQSGKTANYTGLICKAADAGYKLVVIIAGIHNNLRSQTQMRIDEGFVGRDSARLLSNREDKFVGVGSFDQTRRPVTFTNSLRDFNKQSATGVGIPLQNLNEARGLRHQEELQHVEESHRVAEGAQRPCGQPAASMSPCCSLMTRPTTHPSTSSTARARCRASTDRSGTFCRSSNAAATSDTRLHHSQTSS